MMKFALFLVCALVAVQGYQARSVESNERSLSDIIDKIKEVVEKIKKVINELAEQIPWVINHVKEKITEILVKIPNLIKDIQKRANEILAEHGEVGVKCIKEHNDELLELIASGAKGIRDCIPKAGSNFDELKEHINELKVHAHAVRDEIITRVLECVDDNKNNPIGLGNCLKNLASEVKGDVEAVENEAKQVIAEGKEAAKAARIALTECVDGVEADNAAKEEAIFDKINECVNSS